MKELLIVSGLLYGISALFSVVLFLYGLFVTIFWIMSRKPKTTTHYEVLETSIRRRSLLKVGIVLDFRYSISLLSVVDSDSIPEIYDEIPDDYNIKNNVISFSVGYCLESKIVNNVINSNLLT